MYFPRIARLQELIKTYVIAREYDERKAASLLQAIADLRLEIALDAEGRQVFYEQRIIPPLTNNAIQQSDFFSKNDIEYIVKRGIAFLTDNARVSTVNQGTRTRVITREQIAWQQLFSAIQLAGDLRGQQTAFDFPQEMHFAENETLGIATSGQRDENGYIFYHGCTLKDTLDNIRLEDIKKEINEYVSEGQQLVPLLYKFTSNVAGTVGVNPTGGGEILTAKNSRSVILTEVSTTAPDTRITILDEGRNQLICDEVEARGVAADSTNRYTTYYPLPYPHLLRRGDRLRLKVINGSLISGDEQAADVVQNVTFRGYPL